MTVAQAPPARPQGPPRRRRPPPGRNAAPLLILVAMVLLGFLVITERFPLSRETTSTPVRRGCAGGASAEPATPLIGRLNAPFVAVARVEGNSPQRTIPEAQAPDKDWITVTYRVENVLRNDMGCREIIEATNPFPAGQPPSNLDAPLPSRRVLVFLRPARTGAFDYITHAAPSVELSPGAPVYRVTRELASARPEPPGDVTDGFTLLADIATDQTPFFSAGPETDFPARFRMVNTTGEANDPAALGGLQWRLKLVDANQNAWSAAVPVEEGQLHPLDPGFSAQVDAITKPTGGPSPLGAGSYRVEAALDLADGTEIASTAGAIADITCVAGCPGTGG